MRCQKAFDFCPVNNFQNRKAKSQYALDSVKICREIDDHTQGVKFCMAALELDTDKKLLFKKEDLTYLKEYLVNTVRFSKGYIDYKEFRKDHVSIYSKQ